jgi:hypothetical protein
MASLRDIRREIRLVGVAGVIGLSFINRRVIAATEPVNPIEFQKKCLATPTREGDDFRRIRLGQAESFASAKGQWCCYPFYQESQLVTWVTDYQVDSVGRVFVKRCVENAPEKSNVWARPGSANDYFELMSIQQSPPQVVYQRLDPVESKAKHN